MHEISLCENVLNIMQQQALAQRFGKVTKVWLEVGVLASVEIDALRFSFAAVCAHTLANDAELIILEIPGRAWCSPCAAQVAVNQRYDACPVCGSAQLQVVDGEQLRIKELEVE